MEALVFLVDSLAIVILVITSLRNEKRAAGEPMQGPFRYVETLARIRQPRAPLPYQQRPDSTPRKTR